MVRLNSENIRKAYDQLLAQANDEGLTSNFRLSDIKPILEQHIHEQNLWSKEVSFRDMNSSTSIHQIYIDLDLYLTPRRLQYFEDSDLDKTRLKEVFLKEQRHIVILGQPGAGKTTSMKYLSQLLIQNEKFHENQRVPIVVRLRDLYSDYLLINEKHPVSLLHSLRSIIGMQFNVDNSMNSQEEGIRKDRILIDFLENLNVVLILDGLDEIEEDYNKKNVLREVRSLALSLSKAKLILTTRSGDYLYNINNTSIFEICPLTKEQVSKFCNKWLKEPNKAKELLKQIDKSPFRDTMIRPLTLAHLCAIYAKYGKIPEKPKTVYRKIVNLLLEEWDLQRSIVRSSKYGNFEIDRKFEFLTNLSFFLTTMLNKNVFTKEELTEVYRHLSMNFDLPRNEVGKVVNELEAHNGLFLQTGQNSYEFAHKSIQEYLSAEYIVKLPNIPESVGLLLSIPNELALAVSISSSSTVYFSSLILGTLKEDVIIGGFLETFLLRILLEKPDFSPHPLLGITYLYMYTLVYKEYKAESASSKRDNIRDRLLKLLEHFQDKVTFSIKQLIQYYDHQEISDDLNYELELVDVIPSIPRDQIPKKLLVIKSLWI